MITEKLYEHHLREVSGHGGAASSITVSTNRILRRSFGTPDGGQRRSFRLKIEDETRSTLRPAAHRRTPPSAPAVRDLLSPFLASVGVPVGDQARMVRDAARFWRRRSCAAVMMTVDLVTVEVYEEGEIPIPAAAEQADDEVAAAAMEGLATETVAEGGGGGRCAICLEELVVGSEVRRMRCCHVYHGSCVIGWFRKSLSCPLCRSSLLS